MKMKNMMLTVFAGIAALMMSVGAVNANHESQTTCGTYGQIVDKLTNGMGMTKMWGGSGRSLDQQGNPVILEVFESANSGKWASVNSGWVKGVDGNADWRSACLQSVGTNVRN